MARTKVTKAVEHAQRFLNLGAGLEPKQQIARIHAVLDLAEVLDWKDVAYFKKHTLDLDTLKDANLELIAQL